MHLCCHSSNPSSRNPEDLRKGLRTVGNGVGKGHEDDGDEGR